MCGLAGFLTPGVRGGREAANLILGRMADTIQSRGPDDFGIWSDDSGIGLAHRRLSILDLSPAGHQPMQSFNSQYVIVFNGEIYNHMDLRRELDKVSSLAWRGHSDTETLLAGFVVWGIKSTIERCIGMFAFAVWDKNEQTLTLGRDRLGEKPIYYGWQGEKENACFLFGSELKALKAHPVFNAGVSRRALALLMQHNYHHLQHTTNLSYPRMV
jgi:asparagine synthase (glutamine-hydrolysing)